MTDSEIATDDELEAEGRPGSDDGDDDDFSDADYEQAMAKLHRMSAPQAFSESVEDKIRKRSAGRFFGRKAFGDRVPFEVLAVLALVLGLVVFYLLWSSQTGSLRYEKNSKQPTIAPGAKDVVPTPPKTHD